MKRTFLAASIFFCIFTVSTVFAHSGRTDSCGGHNDRKRGGYHIHNFSKYCTCYPDEPECKKDGEVKTPAKKKQRKQ
ncbi:MAG: YHYH domain-containing protein [Thermodesulfovibrionales bacterium]|nr:YHYH domain-containing protein [Thermodesulfovibrionales bacterium]